MDKTKESKNKLYLVSGQEDSFRLSYYVVAQSYDGAADAARKWFSDCYNTTTTGSHSLAVLEVELIAENKHYGKEHSGSYTLLFAERL